MTALIIEDELIFATQLKSHLTAYFENVYAAKHVKDGLEFFDSHRIDIIFLDNFLPGKDGLVAIEDFKNLNPECAVVLMSGVLDIAVISEGLRNGADYILNKRMQLGEGLPPIMRAFKNADKESESSIYRNSIAFDNQSIRIAILEDEETFSYHINWILTGLSQETQIKAFKSVTDFVESLVYETHYDVILSDYYLLGGTIKQIIPVIKAKVPDARIGVFSAQAEIQDAVDVSNLGIDFFIQKDDNWRINFLTELQKMNLF